VRGGSFLLSHKVDLLGVATRALRNRESGYAGPGVMPPVEAAVLSCYVTAREQLTALMEQQGRQDISPVDQEAILRTLMREFMEQLLMGGQEERSD